MKTRLAKARALGTRADAYSAAVGGAVKSQRVQHQPSASMLATPNTRRHASFAARPAHSALTSWAAVKAAHTPHTIEHEMRNRPRGPMNPYTAADTVGDEHVPAINTWTATAAATPPATVPCRSRGTQCADRRNHPSNVRWISAKTKCGSARPPNRQLASASDWACGSCRACRSSSGLINAKSAIF